MSSSHTYSVPVVDRDARPDFARHLPSRSHLSLTTHRPKPLEEACLGSLGVRFTSRDLVGTVRYCLPSDVIFSSGKHSEALSDELACAFGKLIQEVYLFNSSQQESGRSVVALRAIEAPGNPFSRFLTSRGFTRVTPPLGYEFGAEHLYLPLQSSLSPSAP
jgi:hypothetical protein